MKNSNLLIPEKEFAKDELAYDHALMSAKNITTPASIKISTPGVSRSTTRIQYVTGEGPHLVIIDSVDVLVVNSNKIKDKQTRGEKKRKFVEQQNKSKVTPPKHLVNLFTISK